MARSESIQIPGYEILEKAGEGGMATVWIARQLSLDRLVALKILTVDPSRDPAAMLRFQQEARSAARLRHPGIVQIYDAGEWQGVAYYAMEYVPGCTVGELLALRGHLPEKNALTIAMGVADALRYAWDTARLIHCDIKPDNVMIDRDGTVKVADLGVGFVVGGWAKDLRNGDVLGTPNYVSPEQARGEPDLDCRTDIYSLGAMLYHMVTGRLPFEGYPPAEVLKQQVLGYLPDPQEVRPEVSSACAWLLEKMMVKDRTQRYGTWAAVLADLEEVSAGRPPLGDRPHVGQSTVLRGARRAEEPSRAAAPPEPKKRPAPRARIVLPAELRERIQGQLTGMRRAADVQQAWLAAGALSILVVAAYGLLFFWLRTPAELPASAPDALARSLPPRAYVADRAGAAAPAARPEPSPSRGPAAENASWDHPQFRRGAAAYNRAVRLYNGYRKGSQDARTLALIEEACREAIAAFEACRAEAPPGVDVGLYVHRCYQLIADCRQTQVVTSVAPDRAATVPEPAPTPAPATPPAAAEGLQLSPFWTARSPRGSRVVQELNELLAPFGRAEVDLRPAPSLSLRGGLTYLMPATEAAALLGAPLPPRQPVSSPAFPLQSFFYHEVQGDFGDGYSTLLLICDAADQVVAVQLCDRAPQDELGFDPEQYEERWSVYDFVRGRTKAAAKWKIAHEVQREAGGIRLDSELVSHDPEAYFELGAPKARTSLYLPQPMVNLLLHHAQGGGQTAASASDSR